MSSWELLGWAFVAAMIVKIALLVFLVVVATIRSLWPRVPKGATGVRVYHGKAKD